MDSHGPPMGFHGLAVLDHRSPWDPMGRLLVAHAGLEADEQSTMPIM